MRFVNLIPILVISAASSVFASEALAQTELTDSQPVRLETIPEVFNRAFYHGLGNTIDQFTIGGQLNLIFGWRAFPEGSFPENEHARQARLINILSRDVINQETSSGPTIRSRDLKNPFNTSLQQSPDYLLPVEPIEVESELMEQRLIVP